MIKVLDSFISDKIAAGEVIERPASAVKELLENSIDAGASSVIVEIKGASSYIRITDDGCGIASDEIETAFLRHATSKISSVTDLDNIQSLGFRGEALASISAVSRLTIVSRTADEASGTRMILHAGRVVSKEKLGCNKGTTIIVEDLFYNTPARRKFMKSDAREASQIIELMQHYAICYPDIRFMMINKGETLFSTDGSGDAGAVIRTLYPDKAHSDLIPLGGDGVRGFVSDPGTVISSRKGQLFYVNGRLVSSKVIEKALESGYGGRIFSGFPIAILFIDADPYDLDVNIHPGKREILFLHPDDVSERIQAAVRDALSSEASVPRPEVRISEPVVEFNIPESAASPEKSDYSSVSDYTETVYVNEDAGASYTAFSGSIGSDATDDNVNAPVSAQRSIREFLGSIERDSQPEPETETIDYSTVAGASISESEYEYESDSESESVSKPEAVSVSGAQNSASRKEMDFAGLRFAGYVFDTYIIMEAADTLYVFDQHAAHERIFYEKLMQAYHSSGSLSQPIITPVVINVSADVYELRGELLEALGAMGYDIDDFGGGSFIIREIPSYMTAGEAEAFAGAFCDTLEAASGFNSSVIDKLIMKSCKSAVKGGDRLSELEISSLIDDLSACDNPYSCPHGRPTFIKITRYDAERAFRRK